MSVKKFFLLILLFSAAFTKAQNTTPTVTIEEGIFEDAAHHWYDIYEKGMVIYPRAGKPRHKNTELTAIADNILLFQKNNGGWPKNYDMFAVLTQQQKDSLIAAKSATNTTFDNRTTYPQIAALAKVYNVTKEEKYKAAALKGLDFILAAQYDNGGWPQYYPLENNYSRYVTYNDDNFAGIMRFLKPIIDGNAQYNFIDETLRNKLNKAFKKGLDCILKTQINDAGKPTAWCQQYDEKTLQPAWARAFEPPSICNGESVDVVLLLMSINKPSQQIIDAVQNAVAWFKESAIKNTLVKRIDAPLLQTKYTLSKHDVVVIADSTAPLTWTRYYELKTHRPMFCNRDKIVVYTLAEVDRERRDGYAWYTYQPQKVLNMYPAWQQKWAKDKNVL